MADFNTIRTTISFWEGKKFGNVKELEKELRSTADGKKSSSYCSKNSKSQKNTYLYNNQEIGSSVHVFDKYGNNFHLVKKDNVEYSVNSNKKNPTFDSIRFNVGDISIKIIDNDSDGKVGVIDNNDYVQFSQNSRIPDMMLGDFLSGNYPDIQ